MNLNLIILITIIVCVLIIALLYFYIGYQEDIVYNNNDSELSYISCKSFDRENGVSKIHDDCIIECEEQDAYTEILNTYREVEEGETLIEVFYINQNSESDSFTRYVPNMVYELEENIITHTFPPCNRFCDTCSILQKK